MTLTKMKDIQNGAVEVSDPKDGKEWTGGLIHGTSSEVPKYICKVVYQTDEMARKSWKTQYHVTIISIKLSVKVEDYR